MVKIELEDINDNLPVFSPSLYNMTLQSSQPVGETFLVLRATDLDSDQFGEVEFFIKSGNTGGKFQVDKQTGELSLYSSLAGSPALYTLEIMAVDGGGSQSARPAVLNINVLSDLNLSTAPLFASHIYHFTVSEDASKFSAVGKVLPRNLNIGRVFIYPAESLKYFDINPTTGTLSTRHSLDHEKHQTFLLNIGASSSHIGRYRILYISFLSPLLLTRFFLHILCHPRQWGNYSVPLDWSFWHNGKSTSLSASFTAARQSRAAPKIPTRPAGAFGQT